MIATSPLPPAAGKYLRTAVIILAASLVLVLFATVVLIPKREATTTTSYHLLHRREERDNETSGERIGDSKVLWTPPVITATTEASFISLSGGNEKGRNVPLFPESLQAYVNITSNSVRSQCESRSNSSTSVPAVFDRLEGASEHERCQRVMLRQLKILKSAMSKLGLEKRWFLGFGTLLGAVRHQGWIPWDADVDVVMPRKAMTRVRQEWRALLPRDMFLQTEKTDPGFHMMAGGGDRQIRIKDRYSVYSNTSYFTVKKGKTYKTKSRPGLGAQVDILPLVPKKNDRYKLSHHVFHSDMIWPTSEVCFEGERFPAPRNISGFLAMIYGEDYLSIPKERRSSQQEGGAPFQLGNWNPCLATTPTRGSPWSLDWEGQKERHSMSDHDISERDDPFSSFIPPKGIPLEPLPGGIAPPKLAYEDDQMRPYIDSDPAAYTASTRIRSARDQEDDSYSQMKRWKPERVT